MSKLASYIRDSHDAAQVRAEQLVEQATAAGSRKDGGGGPILQGLLGELRQTERHVGAGEVLLEQIQTAASVDSSADLLLGSG